ncbi:hypothetical protein L9F63_016617, partial [Diploptera punctata]
ENPPNRDTFRPLVNKFRETVSLLDNKPKVTKHLLTEEKLDEIVEQITIYGNRIPKTTFTRNWCFEGVSIASYETFTIETIRNNCNA